MRALTSLSLKLCSIALPIAFYFAYTATPAAAQAAGTCCRCKWDLTHYDCPCTYVSGGDGCFINEDGCFTIHTCTN